MTVSYNQFTFLGLLRFYLLLQIYNAVIAIVLLAKTLVYSYFRS